MTATDIDIRGREVEVANAAQSVQSLGEEWNRRKKETVSHLRWMKLLRLYYVAMSELIELIETWREKVFRNAIRFEEKTEAELRSVALQALSISKDIRFALTNARFERQSGSATGALACNDLADQLELMIAEWKTPVRSASRTQWVQTVSPTNLEKTRGILGTPDVTVKLGESPG